MSGLDPVDMSANFGTGRQVSPVRACYRVKGSRRESISLLCVLRAQRIVQSDEKSCPSANFIWRHVLICGLYLRGCTRTCGKREAEQSCQRRKYSDTLHSLLLIIRLDPLRWTENGIWDSG